MKIFVAIICVVVTCFLSMADTLDMTAKTVHSDAKKQVYTLEGEASVKSSTIVINADVITIYKNEKRLVAEGNVHGTLQSGKFYGDRMLYNSDKGTAVIFQGKLILEGNTIFTAREIRYLGNDKFRLVSGSMTTCPDCCQHWSFNAKEIRVKKEGYAVFRDLTFRVGKHRYFYVPAFIYPAKTERAFGLLVPEIGNSSKHGFNYSQDLFIPINASMDFTYSLDYYSKAGTGNGFEYRLARTPGEFGRFYLYTLGDRLINERRSFLDANYHNWFSNGDKIRLKSFEGDDFTLIRDYTFHKYDLAMRTFFTDFSYEMNRAHYQLSVEAHRRNILFRNGENTFYTLPELRFSTRSLQVGGHALNIDASLGDTRNPNLDDNAFLTEHLSVEARRSYRIGRFTLIDAGKASFNGYGNNDTLQSYTDYQAEVKLLSPALERAYGEAHHRIYFFTSIGYHGASEAFPVMLNDSSDFILPDGLYASFGLESILDFGTSSAIGGLYVTRNLSNNVYHNPNDPTLSSGTSPMIGYLQLPLSNLIHLDLDVRYDPALNTIDRMLLTSRFGSHVSLSYLRAYTFGESDTRDSVITSINGRLNNNWTAVFQADYDFSLNDFRSKLISVRYYKDCIGMNLTYRNNAYSTTTSNEFVISLVLRNIGELVKYRLGL